MARNAAKRQTTVHVERNLYRRADNVARIQRWALTTLMEVALEKFVNEMETAPCPSSQRPHVIAAGAASQ